MQRNPQASLPPPPKEEILNSLLSYRRYLGDLPPEPVTPTTPPANGEPAALAPNREPEKSTPEPLGSEQKR